MLLLFEDFILTLGAAPSTNVAVVVVGQNLTRRRQTGELDVAVEGGWSGEAQESNVVPDRITAELGISVFFALKKLVLTNCLIYLKL